MLDSHPLARMSNICPRLPCLSIALSGFAGVTHHIVNGAEAVTSERKIIGYDLCYLPAIQYIVDLPCVPMPYSPTSNANYRDIRHHPKLEVGRTFLG